MTRFNQAIWEQHRCGKPFVLVSIEDGTGSMPRHNGTKMLVCADGSTVGTIGGGQLEAGAIEKAKTVLDEKKTMRYHFALDNEKAAESDMICGGTGDILLQYVAAGQEMIQFLDAGSNGTLYLFGGGHVSRALENTARILEIPTVILDDRAEYANAARFPQSKCIVLDSFAKIPNLPITQKDMLVIVTRGHLGDADALRWALRQNAGYIGMIGSHRKRDMLYQMMRQEGVTEQRLSEVHSPIGLSIGAETPGEIAISIMAEIIQVRAEREKK